MPDSLKKLSQKVISVKAFYVFLRQISLYRVSQKWRKVTIFTNNWKQVVNNIFILFIDAQTLRFRPRSDTTVINNMKNVINNLSSVITKYCLFFFTFGASVIPAWAHTLHFLSDLTGKRQSILAGRDTLHCLRNSRES